MLWVSVLCLCVAQISAQLHATNGRITSVEHNTLAGGDLTNTLQGYELFQEPPTGFASTSGNWLRPLPPIEQLPASARTFYYLWNPRFSNVNTFQTLGPQGANIVGVTNLGTQQTMSFRTVGIPAGNDVQIKLEAPLLEIDPTACGGIIGNSASCRCNVAEANTAVYEPEADKTLTATLDANGVATFNMPVHTYFEHAPFPNQNPYMRTHRRICFRPSGETDWFDTSMYFAVVHGCVDGLSNQDQVDPNQVLRCSVPSQTDATVQNTAPNLLQIRRVNGANRNVLTTEALGFLGEFFDVNGGTADRQRIAESMPQADALNGQFEIFGESEEMRDARLSRNTCCGAAVGTNGDNGLPAALGTQAGVCIDSTISGCCGRRPFDLFNDRCCSRRDSRIGRLDLPCPCVNNLQINTAPPGAATPIFVNRDCNNEGANTLPGAQADDFLGFSQGVTNDRTCCTITKYSTYNDPQRFVDANGNAVIFPQAGFCVLNTPNAANPWRCCDDGNIYDPASHQCCPINGVQTMNLPCPCASDNQCPQQDGPQRCCVQYFPPVYPLGTGPDQCSVFANYPVPGTFVGSDPQIAAESVTYHSPQGFPWRGPVPYTDQYVQSFCPGQCYRTQWQICCNGQLCINEYERCCNSTCCNMFTSKCTEGQRPGALANRVNPLNYNVWFEVCTAKENLTARRAFFVFALPVMLLFATLAGLAIVTVLARRATEHTFDLTEKILVIVAAISVFFAAAFFFSPNWKYGLFIAFVDIAAIMISVIRKRRYSLLLVILLIIKLLFLVDPFGGNIFLSLTGGVPQFSEGPNSNINNPNPEEAIRQQEPINMVGRTDLSSSLLEATGRLWSDQDDCTNFYDYFMFDENVRDSIRRENPRKMTFGYCSRGWITTLLVFAGLLYLLQFLLLLLAIFSLAKKFGRKPSEVIQLEVVQENAPVMVA